MERDEWRTLITQLGSSRLPPVTAHTYLHSWNSFSRPVLLSCDDGNDYVVKGKQVGRAIVNDQIIGKLGEAIGAAVGRVGLVNVPQTLLDAEPKLRHMPAGVSHGSLVIRNCGDRLGIERYNVPENRPRFASLALLYGWLPGNDSQFIYSTDPPGLVHSVDHGHFFPGGPDWTVNNLSGAPAVCADSSIVTTCSLTKEELCGVIPHLPGIDRYIANAVAAPPDEWGISLDERIEVAQYLSRRYSELVVALA